MVAPPPLPVRSVAPLLIAHYDARALALPWRAEPGAPPDPYRVWLAEIMLQQTTVAAVRPYFARFTALWPDVHALAAAEDANVMAAWAGLGYYARARNLLACARVVSGSLGGRFPDTEAGLRALPGIGAYTAAAITAIAFGRRAVVVDGNVERIIARLFRLAEPPRRARKTIHALADAITPDTRAGDFAQAMMDLGRTLCRPRAPDCLACPLSPLCGAAASGTPAAWPRKAARPSRPERQGRAYAIVRDQQIWLVRRPAHGLLAGMLALPSGGWDGSPDLPAGEPMGAVVHIFTHFRLTLCVDRPLALPPGGPQALTPNQPGQWWPIVDIEAAGLPALFAKAIGCV